MDYSLLKLLEDSGFTEKEAKIYLALLALGPADVTEISKKADLKRSIVYVILEGLIKRGHASLLPDHKVNTYQAADPAMILMQLKNLAKNFSEMIPLLRTLKNRGRQRPKITYHESKEAIWKVYEEQAQIEDAFFITSYSRIEKHFPQAIESWIKQKQKGLYRLRGFHVLPNNPRDIEIGKEFLKIEQNIKILNELDKMHMDLAIYGNKFAITSLEDDIFMLIIESEGFVKTLRPIFDIVWLRAKLIN